MDDVLLQVKNLTISAGSRNLVEDVSFSIAGGKIMGLVGESGSGKTITALSLPGLLPPGVTVTSGSAEMHSDNKQLNLYNCSEKELNKVRGNRIAMIFQEPMTSLNPTMRCGLQAMETLVANQSIPSGPAREKIIELFEDVKLPDPKRVFSAWPHELSGGQRQRVMIAMALAGSPELLIADEPTTALDVTVQKSILELLLDIRDKYRLSILFITHDLMVLNQIADEITVMYRGRIVESGSRKEIMEFPKDPYTRGLIACKPSLTEQPYRLPTIGDFLEGRDPRKAKSSGSNEKTMEKEPILMVKDLMVSYGKGKKSRTAVNAVSFDLYRGETLGLVGESGCGKTSLGRAILQLVHAESGTVSYKNTPLNQLSSKELRKIRRSIQIVFQDPYSSLNPGKTIGNILSEPLIVHKLVGKDESVRHRVVQLLERVGLDSEAMDRYPHQFSGGQRQRIGIARALACEPEFIVLDESVSALDVSVQAQVLNLLNDLKESLNLTYIFISHDLAVVKYMSDRILVMSEGNIVESGEPLQIYLNPTQEYTRKLISSIPGTQAIGPAP